MALDLTNIEMGMKNGANAVNNNFKSIEEKMNAPQIKTQSFKADDDSKWGKNNGRVTKQGRIVTVQFQGLNSNDAEETTITTLPSWANPMERVSGVGFEAGAHYSNQLAITVDIGADGSVKAENSQDFLLTNFTITYVSAS